MLVSLGKCGQASPLRFLPHVGLRRRPRCTFPARTNRCHANSIRTHHPRSVSHIDVPSEAKLRRCASIRWLMCTCVSFPDARSFPHACSCFQNSTRLIVQYLHSHIYRFCTGTCIGVPTASCQRLSHFAAPALTSSTISRHALRSTSACFHPCPPRYHRGSSLLP